MSVLLTQCEAKVLSLTLNRPERANALSGELIEALQQTLDSAEAAPDVSVVVLTGTGGNFCSGADTEELKKGEREKRRAVGGYVALVQKIQQLSKPFLVGVDGAAIGGGLGLVALGDVVIATDRSQFRTPELQLGLFPFVISPLLVPVIGHKRFFEMVYTGRPVSAERACEWGLVNQLVTPSKLPLALKALSIQIAQTPLLHLQRGKRAVMQEFSFAELGEELLSLLGQHP